MTMAKVLSVLSLMFGFMAQASWVCYPYLGGEFRETGRIAVVEVAHPHQPTRAPWATVWELGEKGRFGAVLEDHSSADLIRFSSDHDFALVIQNQPVTGLNLRNHDSAKWEKANPSYPGWLTVKDYKAAGRNQDWFKSPLKVVCQNRAERQDRPFWEKDPEPAGEFWKQAP